MTRTAHRLRIPCPVCARPTRVSATGTLRLHFTPDRSDHCLGSLAKVIDDEEEQ